MSAMSIVPMAKGVLNSRRFCREQASTA